MEKIAQFFISYWTQIVVFLGAIGFIFKMFFESIQKKSFKKFELFQEKKIEAFASFSSSLYDLHGKLLSIRKGEKPVDIAQKELDELKNFYTAFYKSMGRISFFTLRNKEFHVYIDVYNAFDNLYYDTVIYLNNFINGQIKSTKISQPLYNSYSDNCFTDIAEKIIRMNNYHKQLYN